MGTGAVGLGIMGLSAGVGFGGAAMVIVDVVLAITAGAGVEVSSGLLHGDAVGMGMVCEVEHALLLVFMGSLVDMVGVSVAIETFRFSSGSVSVA